LAPWDWWWAFTWGVCGIEVYFQVPIAGFFLMFLVRIFSTVDIDVKA
jgi:hypothetical protein